MTIGKMCSEHLTRVMAARLGSAEQGKTAEDTIVAIARSNLLNPSYEFSFPKINQASFDEDKKYLDVSYPRNYFRALYPQIGTVLSSYFDKAYDIVELGAGVPDNEGKTLLSKVMPAKFNIVHTDFNPSIVRLGKKKVPSFRLLDACHLEKCVERQFAACNLIDTLTDKDLQSFLNNLPDGSTFVQFNDLTPFCNRFAWELSLKYDIIFPHIEGKKFCGAYVINNYQAIRASLLDKLDIMELNFLDEFFKYTPEQKERAFTTALKFQNDGISQWVLRAIPREYFSKICIKDHFIKRLQALKAPNLQPLFCGIVKLYDIVDISVTFTRYPLINRVSFDGLNWSYGKIYVLAPGKELIEAELILFALKKHS